MEQTTKGSFLEIFLSKVSLYLFYPDDKAGRIHKYNFQLRNLIVKVLKKTYER